MNEKVERVTRELKQIIGAYLNRREYGNLKMVGGDEHFPTPNIIPGKLTWLLHYEGLSGSSAAIDVNYIEDDDVFELPGEGRKTTDTEEVVLYVKQHLGAIRPERLKDLRGGAQWCKQKNIPLEEALAKIRKTAEECPKCGPTEEEIQLYEGFCREVYSQ